MAKLTLTDIAAGFGAVGTINTNNGLIETALENTLSRDGTSPNTMSVNLDMNSNKITNLTDGTNNQDAVTVAQLDAAVLGTPVTINSFSDVDTTGVVANDMLYFDGSSWVDTAGNLQWNGSAVVLQEIAAAPADVAGKGQIWVKDDVPNTLWFTNDAGTDIQIDAGVSDPLLLSDGTAAAPSYSFTSDTDTGIFRVGVNYLGIALDGTLDWSFRASDNTFRGEVTNGPGIRNVAATQIAPNIHPKADDTNTGLGYPGNDQISIVTGGQPAAQWEEANAQVIQANDMNVGLTASTTQTQGQGVLFSSYNEISTVANANDTVTLPAAAVGRRCVVINNGANTLQVFPASGDDLGAGVDTSETISPGTAKIYIAHDAITWNPIGTATSGGSTPPGRNGCKVYDASAQTISNITKTVVNFDSEAYDTNSFHDTVTNNSRITIPAGVTWVKLKTQIKWTFNSGGFRRIEIRKNGADGAIDDAMTTYQTDFEMTANVGAADATNNWHQQAESGIIQVAPGDYFEVVVTQSSGGDLDIVASQSWFQCEVIE